MVRGTKTRHGTSLPLQSGLVHDRQVTHGLTFAKAGATFQQAQPVVVEGSIQFPFVIQKRS